MALVTALGCGARQLVPSASSVPAPQVAEQRETSGNFKAPVLIEGPLRTYPPDAEARGREGWVTICLRVEADGSTSNIEVADSSGYKPFEEVAVKAMARCRFEPARLDGEPVAYDDICVHSKFWSQDGRNVRRSFKKKKYRHILELIEQGDLVAAESELSVFRERELFTLLEQSYLHSAEYLLQQKRGDRLAAVRALELLGLIRGFSLSHGKEYAEYQQSLFVMYAQLGWHAKALETYEILRRDKVEVSAIDATAQFVSKLIEGNGDVAASARIAAKGWSSARCWRHQPIRREFAITDLDGKIDEFSVLCERHSDRVTSDRVTEGDVWKVPESWGACRIRICGDAGTSFRLIEYGRTAPAEPR